MYFIQVSPSHDLALNCTTAIYRVLMVMEGGLVHTSPSLPCQRMFDLQSPDPLTGVSTVLKDGMLP